jgi:RES domain-containing protein
MTRQDCPEDLEIKAIGLNDLPNNWTNFDQIKITQTIGDNWGKENQTAILQVPSSIVNEEVNYLINPGHPDFRHIKLVKTQPFIFDGRIKH